MSCEDKTYKQHYACFECRKAFKKTNIEEVPKERLQIDEAGRVVRCPQCGERMPDVGYDFEPPKKDDVEGWEEAKAKIEGTLDYAIRNSKIVNVRNHKKRMQFISEYDKNRGMTRAISPSSGRNPKK